jgi:hypothetical protein
MATEPTYCYHCRTHHPRNEMRLIVTKTGKRWRCIRSIEATQQGAGGARGIRPAGVRDQQGGIQEPRPADEQHAAGKVAGMTASDPGQARPHRRRGAPFR